MSKPSPKKSDFKNRIIQWSKDGKSHTWIAVQVGVHAATVYSWIREWAAEEESQTKVLMHWEYENPEGEAELAESASRGDGVDFIAQFLAINPRKHQ